MNNQPSKSLSFSLLCSLVVCILGPCYMLARIGLPDKQAVSVLIFSGISLLLLNLPAWIKEELEKRLEQNNIWWLNELLITFCLTTLIILISYLPSIGPAFIIAAAGYAAFIRNIRHFYRTIDRSFLFRSALMVVFGLWLAGVCWESNALSPLFVENIELTGLIESTLDPLFHISIAQTIKNYGVVSSGLHLLTPIKYHLLSHVVMARLSNLTDTHLIYVYNIGYVLIFPSLLLYSFLMAVDALREKLNIPASCPDLVLLILLLGLTSFLPLVAFDNLPLRVGISNNAIFGSESYLISIWLLLTLFITVLRFPQEGSQLKYALIIVLPILTGLITSAKISTGSLVMAAEGYLFIRLGFFKKAQGWVVLTLTGLIWFLTLYLSLDTGGASKFEPMSYFVTEIKTRFRVFLMIFYFWVYASFVLVAFLYLRKKLTAAELKLSKVLLEVIVIFMVIGFVPAATMKIFGGSALYFLELQRWMAILVVCALLPALTQTIRIRPWMLLAIKTTAVLLICFNTFYYVTKAVKYNLLSRTYYVNRARAPEVQALTSKTILSADKSILSSALVDSFYDSVRNSQTYQTLQALMNLEELNDEKKVLYIKDYNFFSKLLTCYHYFYLVPAFSGFTMYEGKDYWCVGESYFFGKADVTRSTFDSSTFCKTLKENNFKSFYTFDLYTRKYEEIICP